MHVYPASLAHCCNLVRRAGARPLVLRRLVTVRVLGHIVVLAAGLSQQDGSRAGAFVQRCGIGEDVVVSDDVARVEKDEVV